MRKISHSESGRPRVIPSKCDRALRRGNAASEICGRAVRFQISSESGQVLMSTVITGLIIAMIAAGLMRLVFMRFTASAKVKVQTENMRCLQMAVGQFVSYWDNTNPATGASQPVCSSETNVFSCVGTSGQCSCTCTFVGGAYGNLTAGSGGNAASQGLTISVTPGPQGGTAPPCTFAVQSNDMMNPPLGCQ